MNAKSAPARRAIHFALLAALSISVLDYTAAAAATPPRSYKNCTALHKVYPHGVGRRDARDNTSGTPVRTFKISNRVYAYNDGKAPRHLYERDLDRDNDGIACERL